MNFALVIAIVLIATWIIWHNVDLDDDFDEFEP